MGDEVTITLETEFAKAQGPEEADADPWAVDWPWIPTLLRLRLENVYGWFRRTLRLLFILASQLSDEP